MTENGDAEEKVVPVRHYGQWGAAFVTLVLIAMVAHTLFSKIPSGTRSCHLVAGVKQCHPNMVWRYSWNIVGQYFTTSEILHGLLVTIELTAIAMFIGIVLGILIAVMRLSNNRLLSGAAWTYTWFFRGTPVLIQLFVWYYFSLLYPHLSIGIPFTHVTIVSFATTTLLTAFVAAFVALGLNEAAYMSEIARAGLISVDEGQVEAASSLGMRRSQTLRYVILPQAMRVIIPPTGNEIISMLKTTSLVSVIGVVDVLGAAQYISAQNYEVMPLLILASLWYLIVTTIFSIGQFYVERHYAKGALRSPPPTPLQRLRRDLVGISSNFVTRRPPREPRS